MIIQTQCGNCENPIKISIDPRIFRAAGIDFIQVLCHNCMKITDTSVVRHIERNTQVKENTQIK